MRIILQRPTIDKAAQHHGLPPAVINTHFDKEAAAVALAVVEIDAALVIPALGQVGIMVQLPNTAAQQVRGEKRNGSYS